MTNLTPEMLEKAKTAKSAEELLAIAKENGFELTVQEAKAYFEQLTSGSTELSDDALGNVAGGAILKLIIPDTYSEVLYADESNNDGING